MAHSLEGTVHLVERAHSEETTEKVVGIVSWPVHIWVGQEVESTGPGRSRAGDKLQICL